MLKQYLWFVKAFWENEKLAAPWAKAEEHEIPYQNWREKIRMKKDDEVGEKLFGKVRLLEATGGHQVDIEKLLKPLEWKEGIMRIFCEGCGVVLEIDQILAEELAGIANVKLPTAPNNFYFKSRGCGLCDAPDVEPVELLPIQRGA